MSKENRMETIELAKKYIDIIEKRDSKEEEEEEMEVEDKEDDQD